MEQLEEHSVDAYLMMSSRFKGSQRVLARGIRNHRETA